MEHLRGGFSLADEIGVDAEPMQFPALSTWSLPTMAMLFSLWQAITQALQPMQAWLSMTMPHLLNL